MISLERSKVVIVTGASRGLGKEIALCFGKAGNKVLVNYLSHEQDASAVADEILAGGGDAFPFHADVRVTADVNSMIHETIKRWGVLDVLVNNAGATADGLLLRMTERNWDEVIDINLTGPFKCTRAAAGIMSKQHHGHIINIASIVGVQGREGQANYSASKAGLIAFTKACAKEFGCFNIQVNTILPGFLFTSMGSTVSDGIFERVQKENALGRSSDLIEAAAFARHLSSMQNVSGQVFNLDSRVI